MPKAEKIDTDTQKKKFTPKTNVDVMDVQLLHIEATPPR